MKLPNLKKAGKSLLVGSMILGAVSLHSGKIYADSIGPTMGLRSLHNSDLGLDSKILSVGIGGYDNHPKYHDFPSSGELYFVIGDHKYIDKESIENRRRELGVELVLGHFLDKLDKGWAPYIEGSIGISNLRSSLSKNFSSHNVGEWNKIFGAGIGLGYVEKDFMILAGYSARHISKLSHLSVENGIKQDGGFLRIVTKF